MENIYQKEADGTATITLRFKPTGDLVDQETALQQGFQEAGLVARTPQRFAEDQVDREPLSVHERLLHLSRVRVCSPNHSICKVSKCLWSSTPSSPPFFFLYGHIEKSGTGINRATEALEQQNMHRPNSTKTLNSVFPK